MPAEALIKMGVYRIVDNPQTGVPTVQEVYQKAIPPSRIITTDDANSTLRASLPRIYSKVITDELPGGKEFLVAETVAQLVTQANT
jgi:hypothetical protein